MTPKILGWRVGLSVIGFIIRDFLVKGESLEVDSLMSPCLGKDLHETVDPAPDFFPVVSDDSHHRSIGL